MNPVGDKLTSALRRFAECEHKYWKCDKCGCVADVGTIASEYRARVNELEDEIERLRRERDEARDAARWWYRRDRTGHDPSAITDQHALWPWLADDTMEDSDA